VAARKLSTVRKVLVCQILIIAVVVLGFVFMHDLHKTISSMLGGLAAFVPNAFFGWLITSSVGASPRKAVNAFYIGEVGKWMLTIAMFVLAFKYPGIEIFPLFATYILAISVFWFALLMR
jgi:ATP synthase protein I